MSPNVRHATVADAPALARLIGVLDRDVADVDVVERVRALPEGHRVLVAEVGSTVMGFVHVGVDPNLLDGQRAQLSGFAVATEHRGVGVEEALLAAADAWAREHGCTELWARSDTPGDQEDACLRTHGFEEVDGAPVLARAVASVQATANGAATVRVISTMPEV